MIYTGGTQAIQNLLIIAALPFSVVIIAMIWSLLKSLSEEKPRNSNKVLIKHRDPDVLEYRSSKHIDESADVTKKIIITSKVIKLNTKPSG